MLIESLPSAYSPLGDPVPGVTYVKYFTEMGIAEGAYRNCGPPYYPADLEMEVTVRGRHEWRRLYTGLVGNPPPMVHTKHGSRLWNQELYVYRQELRHILGAMIEQLGLMKALPRPGSAARQYLIEPLPEDFGEPPDPEVAIKAEQDRLAKFEEQELRQPCRCPKCSRCPNTVRLRSVTGKCTPCQQANHGGQSLPSPEKPMKWNIAFDGTPKAVIDQLEKFNHLPVPVTQMLVDCLKAFPDSEQVMLDTNGDIDTDKGHGNAFIKLSIFKKAA